MLVKFEEIDLTESFIIKGKECSREYLRAILTALSGGESSKLKMLTLHGRKSKLAADLAKARERGLKVKVDLSLKTTVTGLTLTTMMKLTTMMTLTTMVIWTAMIALVMMMTMTWKILIRL